MPGRLLPSLPTIRLRGAMALCGLAAVLAPPLAAQETPAPDSVAALRAEIDALRADYEGRLAALEGRLAQLEGSGAALPVPAPEPSPAPPAVPPEVTAGAPPAITPMPAEVPSGAAPQSATYFNPSVSVIGNFLAAGGHGAGEETAASAELRESELSLQAIVDPYARADFFLAFGEEGVEMEEGYATFTSLPAGLLLKVGRMRAGFGKVNTLHAHTLPWVDQPLPVVNLLGSDEGWIGTGVSVARLIPLGETFSEATLQVFRGDAEGLFEGERRSDLAYNAHYRLFRDLTEATNLDLGASYGIGPNGIAEGSDTQLAGLDVTLRWKPLQTAIYRSLTMRGEVVRSRREQEEGTAEALGWFLGGDYQLARRWTVGARYESAERADDASLRDSGVAALLAFRPSEFSLLRAEARRRRFAEDVTADEIFLQLQFAIGAHGAHPF
jgi:hypothetical protein